ncbi:hypothetical protein [Sulfurospirillum sp.]|uniref:hypothetical protein n=1 Tax=Sulfurospirillum sp. TaxID=2053622 RepID=UPI002FDD98E8
MYVHESGVGYWLYIQNDKYANQVLEEREAEISGTVVDKPYDSSLHDYIEKIVASIPELKEYEANGGGLGVVILPESASSTLKDAVSQTTTKMLDEGEDENILKGVLGIIKYNYSADVEYGNGVSTSKNDTYTYDLESVNNVLSKFKDIYASNGALSAGLGKFSQYLGEIYDELQKDANPKSDTETTATNSTDNDLVETLMQEMEKSEEDKTPGSDQLNKKLYKNYIKSLKSSLVGGLLQQSS